MGVSLSNLTLEPICDCCDNFVKYVLNGCKSECGSPSCCVCKSEVINHEFVGEIVTTYQTMYTLYRVMNHVVLIHTPLEC